MISDSCEFVVVRHGQTVANRTRILQGQINSPLDTLGEAQARAVAERLRSEPFDFIYTSDLGRAADTAAAIRKYHPDVPFEMTRSLREWNLGALEGHPLSELYEIYPDIMKAFKREAPEIHVPDGESKSDILRRVGTFFDEAAERHPGKRILIVTHGGVLQILFRKAVGPTEAGNFLSLSGNASMSVFRRLGAGWQLVTWNDCSHLRDVGQNELFTY